MKKGEIYTGIVEKMEFPNKGIIYIEEEKVIVKNALPGQTVRFVIHKKRNGKCEGRIVEMEVSSPLETEKNRCPHFGTCGGCLMQSIPYEEQLKIKEQQVKKLLEQAGLDNVGNPGYKFEGIKPSPVWECYRNKMEFSFGDEEKGGALALGMHRRSSFYDVVNVDHCRIVHSDFTRILTATREYFLKEAVPFYKKLKQEGYLRHLVIRRGLKTREILVALATTGQTGFLTGRGECSDTESWAECEAKRGQKDLPEEGAGEKRISGFEAELERKLLEGWKNRLLQLPLEGKFAGILHIRNNSPADVVKSDETSLLYGREFFYEELLGLRFQISLFSFFQTNSLGAEVLYETVREYIGDTKGKVIFDLYSGTGTIAQMMASVAEKVVGVEIVEEAVEAARQNAAMNGLENCRFIAGDVMKVVGNLEEKPDLIVLDPPRDGIHPKALEQIIRFEVNRIVYISCKPTSLVRDLGVLFGNGYKVEKACCVDLFPSTGHVETVVLLVKKC